MITVLEWVLLTLAIILEVIAFFTIIVILCKQYGNKEIKQCSETPKLNDKPEMTKEEIESIAFRPIEYR